MPSTNSLNVNQLLDTAVTAARAGGDVLLRYMREGVQIRNKAGEGGKTYDLVSDADIESERAVAESIRTQHPDHDLLGEESLSLSDTNVQDLWIIDPLDGTNNFAHGIPHFAVSIAYYHQGVPTVAAILNPARDDCFTAIRGGGAFHQGNPVRVSDKKTLDDTLIGCGFYYDRGEMMRSTLLSIEEFFGKDIHGIRRFGTASLDLCQVGCGQFGGFFEYQLAAWDFAAGRLFIEEAGGRVTDARGGDLPIGKTSIVASNGHLHDAMLAITRPNHP